MDVLRSALIVAATVATPPAIAAPLVDYQPDPHIAGSLTFNSASTPNGFVATGFSLASASLLTGLSFGVSSDGYHPVPAMPISVTWRFLSIDANGAPATILAEGRADDLSRSVISVTPFAGQNYEQTRFAFALPSVALAAGSYFVALHSNSPEKISLLGAALPAGFAGRPVRFTTIDGTSWRGFAGASVVSLSGDAASAVPEPKSWATMLLGFGMIGTAKRTRRRRAAASSC